MTITVTIDTSNMSESAINEHIQELSEGIPFFGHKMFHSDGETLPIGRTTHAELDENKNIIAHIKIPKGLKLGGKYPYSIEELLQEETENPLRIGDYCYRGKVKQ